MVSPDKMVTPSKRMSPNSIISRKTTSKKELKSSKDTKLICRMFDLKIDENAGIHNQKVYAGTYRFAGIDNVICSKTTNRFSMDVSKIYETPRHMLLINNPVAKDVSISELNNFIENNSLVLRSYSTGSFMCADFASRLHNKAETSGIRCGYIVIKFNDGDHALNVFCAHDNNEQRIVFVDMTAKKHLLMNALQFKKLYGYNIR